MKTVGRRDTVSFGVYPQYNKMDTGAVTMTSEARLKRETSTQINEKDTKIARHLHLKEPSEVPK